MFLPIGDTPNPPRFVPWMNWLLIGINAGVYLLISLPMAARGADPGHPLFEEYLRHLIPALPSNMNLRELVAQLSAYDLFIFSHGFKPGAPNVPDLFFSMFLHANFLHLAGNMLFLWIYGDNVEYRLGKTGYLLLYLATGAVATLAFSLFAKDSMIPMVGASGAISGVLGLYFILFPRNQVKVFIFFFPILFDVILLPARLVLGVYLLFDNLLPFLFNTQTGVAYGAHIGGFIAGLGAAWAGERVNWGWPGKDRLWKLGSPSGSKRAQPPAEEEKSPLQEVRSALEARDLDAAVRTLGKMDSRQMAGLRPNECVALAERLEGMGHSIAASNLLRRCLSSQGRSKDLAEVFLALGLLRLRQGQATAAYQHLLSVFDYQPSPETADRAREALDTIEVYRRHRM